VPYKLLNNIFLLLCAALPSAALAQTPTVVNATDAEDKGTVWNVGFSGMRHNLHDQEDAGNELTGNSGVVQIGRGHIGQSWFLFGSADIILGPYEQVRAEKIKTDFFGTGFSAWTGYAVTPGTLRHSVGSAGVTLGISYADIVGRSVARSAVGDDDRYIDNYSLRTSTWLAVPGTFFATLKKARPKGNTPELLLTRIEGYIFNFGVGFPVISDYRARYEVKDLRNSKNDAKKHESGHLEGMTFLLSFNPLLGI